jgi:hypothetical protein
VFLSSLTSSALVQVSASGRRHDWEERISSVAVLWREAVGWLRSGCGWSFDSVVLLKPTRPTRGCGNVHLV